ncbi:MAG: AgmX/PglI C-terminal domain-containing protein [Myxococcales bacterium]
MEEAREATPRIQRFRGVDRTFVAIVAGVFLFNYGLASALASRAKTWTDDWALTEEVIARGRIATWLPMPPKPEKQAPSKEGVGTGIAAAATTRGAPGPKKSSASLERMVKTVGLTSLIGSEGIGNGLKIGNDLWGGHEATSLEKAMREASSQGVEVRLDGGGEHRGTDTGTATSIGEVKTEGGAGDGAKKLSDRGPAGPRPRVTFDDDDDPPTATPGCDRAAIAKVVKRGLTALQACYERETKKLPTLAGKLVVRFTIGGDGHVNDVEFDEDTLGSAALRRCIDRSFRLWSFPSSPGECVASHPFLFAPVP